MESWNKPNETFVRLCTQMDEESTRLEDIVLEPSFPQVARAGPDSLQKFLFRDPILENLIEIILTDKLPTFVEPISPPDKKTEYEANQKIIKGALAIFTSGNPQIAHLFLQNQYFLDKMRTFQTTEFIHNQKVCGRFQIVFEFLARTTKGQSLTIFADQMQYIVQNLDHLVLRELFITLNLDHGVSEKQAEQICEQLSFGKVFWVANTIKILVRQKPELAQGFRSEKPSAMIIECAKKTNLDFSSIIEVLHLIPLLQIKASYAPPSFPENPAIRGAFLNAFPTKDTQELLKFFEPAPPVLTQARYNSIIRLEFEELDDFVLHNDIEQRILSALQKQKYNGLLYELALLLQDELGKQFPTLNQSLTNRMPTFEGPDLEEFEIPPDEPDFPLELEAEVDDFVPLAPAIQPPSLEIST